MSGDNGYTPATPGDFFCPTGGKWYACETGTKFVGCCLSDPCKNGCFADQLKPAGVSTTIYNQYPGGSCGGNTDFWTCLSAPTFWGCCNSDPCMNNSTCATGDLEPTFMDRPDQLEYFGALNVLLSSTVSTTGTPSTALSSTASSGTTSAQSSTTAESSSSKPSGALIGGVVGGVVALIAIVAGIVFLLCRRKRRKAKANNDELAQSATMTAHPEKGFVAGAYSPQGTAQSPPPTYAYNHSGYNEPQELFAGPVEPASNANRRSELQGHDASYRISELSPVTVGPRELETPETSPRLPQEEFGSSQAKQEALTGLGLTDVPQQGHR